MRVVESVIEQNIDELVKDFELYSKKLFYDEDSKKLTHPGEFGVYREKMVSKFLKNFLPKSFEISSGFVVNNNDEISSQCDLIVYCKDLTPLISDYNNQEFYTAETVVAIGEIKSKLSKNEFKKTLNRLAQNKKLRDSTLSPSTHKSRYGSFNPLNHPYDTIFSFLVCEKLDFNTDNLLNEISAFYDDDVISQHKHNLILSIKDGLLTYYSKNDKTGETGTIHYPFFNGKALKNLFVDEENKYVPIKLFGSYFYQAVTSHTILIPDLIRYNIKYDNQILKYEE